MPGHIQINCRRCGQPHYISPLSVPFTYWTCLPQRSCGAINVIKVWPK